MQSFDEAARLSKALLDTGMTSASAMGEGLNAITAEAGDYARATAEKGAAALEALMSAGSVEAAAQVQAEFARAAYEGFVGQAARMSALYADLARDVCLPFELALRRPA